MIKNSVLCQSGEAVRIPRDLIKLFIFIYVYCSGGLWLNPFPNNELAPVNGEWTRIESKVANFIQENFNEFICVYIFIA